ncbi:S8 family peptidase [Mesonia sp. MT50]|uniref:S8 family peptidase n=1 Tax=Mesonia profundi TaxID=3070998 RepID=A0ABU1A0F1_9FLAO|nr:S8 family peptidase [Mesonia profundi]MDQ7917127.1 S8 family peptidase [Mesonia profundi]
MDRLPHLKFVQKIQGNPRLHGGGGQNERTKENKKNRKKHSSYLSKRTIDLRESWTLNLSEREEQELAPLDKDIIPIFLQTDPDLLSDISFDLQKFGIEIISEEDDGFIVGASNDGLRALEEKINGFVHSGHGTAKIAKLWEIITGERKDWKPKHILSEELYNKWPHINEKDIYKVEVGVAFDKPLGKEPDPTKQGGIKRLEKYRQKQIERDDLWMERETHFDNFIKIYGSRTSSFIDLEDSFSCELEISGSGLKDLVINYPFVFEVTEVDIIKGRVGESFEIDEKNIDILPPSEESAEVGVIDSGIMEGHKYLSLAIDSSKSKSYVHNDESTADKVIEGGHGTKVAGAIIYPLGINGLSSPYQLPCRIRNLRVLNDNNQLKNKFPAELMFDIVNDNEDCDLFNMSINSKFPFRIKHMSTWAAALDLLIHEKNKIFIISSGNIDRPKIRSYINEGLEYPNYLNEAFCRIANPGQSCFSLVVGSINHSSFEDDNWVSLGKENDISAFSRIGNGIWGMIKPDVVEFGGGFVRSKNGVNSVREIEETSIELVRSTLNGGSAYGQDTSGTSFSTPKVSNIVAKLKELYPKENNNLIRALVAQGARLPEAHFFNPTTSSLKHFGYGIPSLERVTRNTEQRVTFYNTSKIRAEEGHIYSLKIPESIRNQANEYDILIEVTLSFTAKVRRTRQKTKSYLSTWLDWTASYFDEPLDKFRKRALRVIEDEEVDYEKENGKQVVKWKIRENKDWGSVKGLSRNNSSLQKDWVIIKAYELSEEISFSVQGHKGWDVNKEEIPYAFTVSIEAINDDVQIYEEIKIENEIEIEL